PDQRGGHRRHAARGRARGFGAFELRHAPLEHGHGRVGVARVDVARLGVVEARLALFGGVVDEALGGEDRLRGLAELGAQRAGVHEAGFGAVFFGGRGHSRTPWTAFWAWLPSAHKKAGRGKNPKPGPSVPGLLAICFTWLQAGRLK